MFRRDTVEKELICIVCGHIMFVPRLITRDRGVGHIKDMWCPSCMMSQKHIEKGNFSLVFLKQKVGNNLHLTEREKEFLRVLSSYSSDLDTVLGNNKKENNLILNKKIKTRP